MHAGEESAPLGPRCRMDMGKVWNVLTWPFRMLGRFFRALGGWLFAVADTWYAIPLAAGIAFGAWWTSRNLHFGTTGDFALIALLVLAVLTLVRRVWRLQTKRESVNSAIISQAKARGEGKEPNTLLEVPWDKPASHLRYAAQRMRTNALYALGGVLLAIVSALAFYIYGPSLVEGFEVHRLETLRAIVTESETEARQARNELKAAEDRAQAIAQEMANAKPANGVIGTEALIKQRDRQDYDVMVAKDHAENAASRAREARVILNQALPSANLTSSSNVTNLISRLAIGILLVFLVQILAGIYRHSTRMAAFYQGRADGLLVKAQDEYKATELKDLVDWFAGDKVQFDVAPKSPTDTGAELVKAAIESTGKTVAKATEKAKEG